MGSKIGYDDDRIEQAGHQAERQWCPVRVEFHATNICRFPIEYKILGILWLAITEDKNINERGIIMGIGAAIGLGVGALGGYLGSKKQAKASERAATSQSQALMRGQDIQKEMWLKALELGKPYRELGYGVLPQLNALATGDITQSPEYQWRLGQGEEAINRAMAARGIQFSSPAINALAKYTGGLTSEMAGNQFNRLTQLANLGQGATAQAVGGAGQYGGNMANLYGNIGQVQGQNLMNQGNIQANMWGNLGAMPMNAFNTYSLGKMAGVF